MFQCTGLHYSEIRSRQDAIEIEGAGTAKILKKGERKGLRNLGLYDLSSVAGRSHCHSPLYSIKEMEQHQNPSNFRAVMNSYNVNSQQEIFREGFTQRSQPRNPRTASMAKRGAISRAEKAPFLQNLPARSNHIQFLYNDNAHLDVPYGRDKLIEEAILKKQEIEEKIAANAWPPPPKTTDTDSNSKNNNTNKIYTENNKDPAFTSTNKLSFKPFPILSKTIKFLRQEGWLCSVIQEGEILIFHTFKKNPLGMFEMQKIQLDELNEEKKTLKTINKINLERYSQMRNVNMDLNIKLDKLTQDLCESNETSVIQREDLGTILTQFQQIINKICSELCLACEGKIKPFYLKHTQDLVDVHRKDLEKTSTTGLYGDSTKQLVKDCVGSLSTKIGNIKCSLEETLKRQKEVLRGENEELNENQKARRAKKHSKNKGKENSLSLDKDIVKFLIIQNAFNGVAQANIQEQKVSNAKIAEDVLNETSWSDHYSPDSDESPREVTSSTLSEMDLSNYFNASDQQTTGNCDSVEVHNLHNEYHPEEISANEIEDGCPFLQTFANSELDVNILGGLRLHPRFEYSETSTSTGSTSTLEKLFQNAGLSSMDFLSDNSGEIITIEEEDED